MNNLTAELKMLLNELGVRIVWDGEVYEVGRVDGPGGYPCCTYSTIDINEAIEKAADIVKQKWQQIGYNQAIIDGGVDGQ